MKRAFITGITGQDGSYLANLLLSKGYQVFGGYRRTSTQDFWRLKYLEAFGHENLTLIEHDLTDLGSAIRALTIAEPDEVYNLASQSYVAVSFKEPTTTAQISGLGALHLLEAIKIVNKKIRMYQASSAEMFGKVQAMPQDETTPFYPRSPYANAKLFAHWSAVNYREAYDMFVSCGILFNHESPLRGMEFVTRKIGVAAARITLGVQSELKLGNLDSKRDWGFAGEFVEGMWRMLQAKTPDTFVLATGKTTTVRDFVNLSFTAAGLPIAWSGAGDLEVGRSLADGKVVVSIDPAHRRPSEVDVLMGSPAKAEKILGWTPKMTVKDLAALIVSAENEALSGNASSKIVG